MNWLERFIRWLTGDLPAPTPSTEAAIPDPAPNPAPDPDAAPTRELPGGPAPTRETADTNDPAAYGVTTERVDAPPGTTYWRVRRVHHLGPQENGGRHHIYLDAVDEAGQRVYNSQAKITWEGGEFTVTVDKPTSEPGANYPMYKWQTCTVVMLGAPSDAVHGLSASHPDEPNPDGSSSGNTLFHHSFLVEFERAVAEGTAPEPSPTPSPLPIQGMIQGTVDGGGGMMLQLLREGTVLAQGKLGRGGAFRLRSLDPGSYEIQVRQEVDSPVLVASGPVTVDSPEPVTVNLAVPSESPPAPMPPPQPEDDGTIFTHYVLFGSADRPQTRVHLLLLAEKLAAQAIPFGFLPEEAVLAEQITIIGGPEDVSPQTAANLVAAGSTVRRVTGSGITIYNAL